MDWLIEERSTDPDATTTDEDRSLNLPLTSGVITSAEIHGYICRAKRR